MNSTPAWDAVSEGCYRSGAIVRSRAVTGSGPGGGAVSGGGKTGVGIGRVGIVGGESGRYGDGPRPVYGGWARRETHEPER